jgi:steroid delta-isomerase-like uncharacterized protein
MELDCMSAEEHQAVVRRYIEEAWNKGNVGIIDELMSARYARYMGVGAPPLDREGQKQRILTFRRAFPDLRLDVEDMVADGEKVSFRLVLRGTHQGEFLGVRPTGNVMQVGAVDIARFEGGKIVEQWGQTDLLGLMRQIGAIPPAE